MKPVSISNNTTRAIIFASMMISGIAGVFYVQNSTAADGSMSGQSGQSGSTAGQSSTGQGSHAPDKKGSPHKKHGTSGQDAYGTGSSSGQVTESEKTGVTGEEPSGGRSETSEQKRDPGGY
jgi:hypothetical protein